MRVRKIASIFWNALRNFHNDDCLYTSAALSYFAVLSLVPLILLSNLFAAKIYGTKSFIVSSLIDFASRLFPSVPHEVMANLENPSISIHALGVIGFIITLWAATLVFSSTSKALDVVFKTGEIKTFKRHLTSLGSVFVVCVIILGMVISKAIYWTLIRIASSKANISIPQTGIFSRYIFPPLFYFSFCCFIYYFLPSRNVPRRSVIYGGLSAVFVWEIGRYIFLWYMSTITKINLIYGSISTLIIAVLWVYFSIAVMLWGAEFAYSHELSLSPQGK
jgi:membrane protein